tara:strand:- start:3937 stop:4323 length:387 start_codon:yes stop_codon:yes gene_type:complete
MSTNNIIKISIILIIIAILLGAFSSHYFNKILLEKQISSINIGIRYQLFHSLSLLLICLNKKKFNKHINKSLYFMLAGTLLFSFSIYLLNFNKYVQIPLFILGPLTPFGGILLITSWVFLFFSIKKVN